MPRKTKIEAEKTRERILSSALTLFVKKGYERTTFNDIAARLKMTKGAVYWHFASKDALFVSLVREMLDKFSRQTHELMPKEEDLTFPAVADMMVATASRIMEDSVGKSFFMLMFTQMKWGDASMAKVREEILANSKESPYPTFIRAIENDKAAGRVKKDANAVAVAAASVSVWDGLVRAAIDRMLECDLLETLRMVYASYWNSIKA
ncbi:MAG: TetR family transcriptional regulator [Kiritimatiellae bacterium]|nr:TetR family transcriptional regulator [Kiritimatiellia bacterium]